jgi:hypothetical protein
MAAEGKHCIKGGARQLRVHNCRKRARQQGIRHRRERLARQQEVSTAAVDGHGVRGWGTAAEAVYSTRVPMAAVHVYGSRFKARQHRVGLGAEDMHPHKYERLCGCISTTPPGRTPIEVTHLHLQKYTQNHTRTHMHPNKYEPFQKCTSTTPQGRTPIYGTHVHLQKYKCVGLCASITPHEAIHTTQIKLNMHCGRNHTWLQTILIHPLCHIAGAAHAPATLGQTWTASGMTASAMYKPVRNCRTAGKKCSTTVGMVKVAG